MSALDVYMEKLEELTNLLDTASKAYYIDNSPIMSDEDFDMKLKELQKMEEESGIVLQNSPTLRVGSDLRDEFGKIEHPKGYPMLTIENVYTDNDLIKWFQKMYKTYGVKYYNVSFKYDGISCELHYKNGLLESASTRGDKLVGDDITDNVRTIKSVPLKINTIGDVYIRGEILMPKSKLEELNKERETAGEKIFANCRNACSGSVKQLDSRITAKRGLIFKPWDIVGMKEKISQTSKACYLEDWGFDLSEREKGFAFSVGEFSDTEMMQIVTMLNEFWGVASTRDYDCDGIVLKIDDTAIQSQIGTKDNRAIEWGIARKWNESFEVTTTLLDVDFQVGRTGNITPVGKLEPVACDGVVISNVILNNEKFIKDLDLHKGDEVRIVRSGGVIPILVGNNKKNFFTQKDGLTDIVFPKKCPSCDAPLVKNGEIWKCPNSDYCEPQVAGRVEQWCSKDCMNIPNVGPALIHDLINAELLTEPVDLYMIADEYTPARLVDCLGEGYGIKSMSTFIQNINISRTRTFDKVLYGLSIEGIGKQNAKVLANHFGSYAKLSYATEEELMEVEGIGPNLAHSIVSWFKKNDLDVEYEDSYVKYLVDARLNLSMKPEKQIAQEKQILLGLNIVFSGKSSNWDGDQVEEVFTSYGAKCGHSVSKKTNYLVIGDSPGPSKVSKAKSLGVEIISEVDFIKKFDIPTEFETDHFVFPDDLDKLTPKKEEKEEEAVEALF